MSVIITYDRVELDSAEFKEWLDGLSPIESAGTINSFFDCPLARFFTSQGFMFRRVEKYHLVIFEGKKLLLPKWAQDFIYNFDWESKKLGHKFKKTLSARRTRQILAETLAA